MNEREVLRYIGAYFLDTNLPKDFEAKEYVEAMDKTYRTLSEMNITNCEKIDETTFKITLCRPGLLIGSKGKTINQIEKLLGVKITIKENTMAGWVYPPDVRTY